MGQRGDDDAALLAAFVAGDADAFVVLYRRRLAAVIQFFMRRTGNAEVSADLTAEVFAAAYLAAPRFRAGPEPAGAWLLGIARHKLLGSRRRDRIESSARRRLAIERIDLSEDSIAARRRPHLARTPKDAHQPQRLKDV